MAVTVAEADVYFSTHVLHNSEWTTADTDTKQRALNNAKNQVYRLYRNLSEATNPAPDAAVFEQALWLLRLDDALLKAPAGLLSVSVNGIHVQVQNLGRYICPEAQLMLGRRVGRFAR